MEQDQNDFLPQPELLLFETRLTEVLHELNIKRVGGYSCYYLHLLLKERDVHKLPSMTQ